MSTEARPLIIGSSPHIRLRQSVPDSKYHVSLAQVTDDVISVRTFGNSAKMLVMTTVIACVATEHVSCRIAGKATTIGDWSVTVTGLILGLTLPPATPLWMAVLGSIFGVAITKSLFGGLGYNCFNPALVGRAFLQIAFPITLTTWTPPNLVGRFASVLPSTLTMPFMRSDGEALQAYVQRALEAGGVDGWSGATPLSLWKFSETPQFEELPRLFMGSIAGSAGETATWLIILGGAYLIVRNMMNWRIPVGMLLSAFLLSGAFWLSDKSAYPSPMFMLFSGGLMFGAVFMASDMVASPMTTSGVWIYGFFIGIVTVVIRIFGALPEGVMFAILLGNAVSPLITSATQPRTYGLVRQKNG